MTTTDGVGISTDREQLVRRMLEAFLRDPSDSEVDGLFTEDFQGRSPNLEVRSRDELKAALEGREEGITEPRFEMEIFDVPGGPTVAEWRVTAIHSGPVDLGDGVVIPGSGNRIDLRGVSVVEVRNGRVRAARHYFDQALLLEQLMIPDSGTLPRR